LFLLHVSFAWTSVKKFWKWNFCGKIWRKEK